MRRGGAYGLRESEIPSILYCFDFPMGLDCGCNMGTPLSRNGGKFIERRDLMSIFKKLVFILVLMSALIIGAVGCPNKEGPAEEEKKQSPREAAEEAARKVEDAGKKLERAAEEANE